jgi:hypothetical protein
VVKPVVPGAIAPVTPVVPGAVTPVKPIAPGAVAPLKPAASVPAVLPKGNDKTGTTAVKTPPPKETARITVKPSLPTARPAVAAGVKPAVVVAGAAAATAAAATPAAKGTPVATPAVAVKKADAVPIAGIPAFEEDKSTTLTTALAGALFLLTWGTAGILLASYFRML